jgi:hypothetical protein
VVLIGGVFNMWGALVAAFLLRVLPQILDQKLGLQPELLTIIFGIGIMQVLLVQPKGIVEDLRRLGVFVGRTLRLVDRPGPGPTPVVEPPPAPAATIEREAS